MNRRSARVMLVLFLGLAGCADGCDCGAGSESASAPKPAPVAVDPAAATPSGGGGAPATDAGAPPRYAPRGYIPLEDGELRTQIESKSKAVAWEKRLGKPVAPAALSKVLIDRVGDFNAAEPVSVDAQEAGDVSLVSASRQYKSGQGTLSIKISDTALAIPLRTGFRDQLLVVADEGGGNQRAELLEGALGLVAFHPHERVSRAIVLVRNRFLVELIARNTDDAEAAKRALRALRLDALR